MTTTNTLNHEGTKDTKNKAIALDGVDVQMAQQLTDQYYRATSGMIEVLKFGAMMMHLEEKLVHDGPVTGGRGNKGGMRDWLRTHSPEIPHSTAWRLKAVAESIQSEYTQIVGSKVAKQVTLTDLVMTPADQLPEAVRSKQLDLFDYVKGTSQRSWLDKLTPVAERGGKTYDRGNGKGTAVKPTLDQQVAALKQLCTGTAASLKTLHDSKAWVALNDAENDGLIDHLEEVLKGAKSWRKMSQADRDAALTEALR